MSKMWAVWSDHVHSKPATSHNCESFPEGRLKHPDSLLGASITIFHLINVRLLVTSWDWPCVRAHRYSGRWAFPGYAYMATTGNTPIIVLYTWLCVAPSPSQSTHAPQWSRSELLVSFPTLPHLFNRPNKASDTLSTTALNKSPVQSCLSVSHRAGNSVSSSFQNRRVMFHVFSFTPSCVHESGRAWPNRYMFTCLTGVRC